MMPKLGNYTVLRTIKRKNMLTIMSGNFLIYCNRKTNQFRIILLEH